MSLVVEETTDLTFWISPEGNYRQYTLRLSHSEGRILTCNYDHHAKPRANCDNSPDRQLYNGKSNRKSQLINKTALLLVTSSAKLSQRTLTMDFTTSTVFNDGTLQINLNVANYITLRIYRVSPSYKHYYDLKPTKPLRLLKLGDEFPTQMSSTSTTDSDQNKISTTPKDSRLAIIFGVMIPLIIILPVVAYYVGTLVVKHRKQNTSQTNTNMGTSAAFGSSTLGQIPSTFTWTTADSTAPH